MENLKNNSDKGQTLVAGQPSCGYLHAFSRKTPVICASSNSAQALVHGMLGTLRESQ
jgi:hypothetical protein